VKRITYPQACVLQALSKGKGHGFDVMQATGLPSGTVYPALRRFEQAGLVNSSWEDPEDATGEHRPRRRNYQLTPSGRAALARASERYRLHLEIFGTDSSTSASRA